MTGLPKLTASRTVTTVLVAALAVLMVAAGAFALTRVGVPRTEPAAVDAATAAAVTSPESPRMSRLVPHAAAPGVSAVLEVTGPDCDPAVINADLLFPNSGARVLDCQAGWAVMASAVSGDPYWVAFSDGRWRRVPGVAESLGTCSDQAIARGAPAWMARKHLRGCATLERSVRAAPPPVRAPEVRTSSPPAPPPLPPERPTRTTTRTRAPVEAPTTPATTAPPTSVPTPTTPTTPTMPTTPDTSTPTSETTPSTAADDIPAADGE